MSYQNQPSSSPLPSQQEAQTTLSNPRFARVRGWLRSRTGRVIIPLVALLVGMALGITALFLFGESGVGPIIVIPVVNADFSNIPVTRFAQSFENQINQQLEKRPEGLPVGFQYCNTEVRTDSAGLFVTYTATPV